MRIGVNPEKIKKTKISYKNHRVIIPVFIPDNDSYFDNSLEILKKCIKSLLKTVDVENTNITIINNNSKVEVKEFLLELVKLKKIDKYIESTVNYGKVYSVLAEARASYEPFITIVDSDVHFFNNWQNSVNEVFEKFKNVGVVGLTPDPHMAFYCNNSLIFDKLFRIKKGKIVDNYDLELFEKGIGNNQFFSNKNNNWKEKQYYLEKNKLKVVIGASHFASTYRKELFNKIPCSNPIYVFPGGELTFLDTPIDKLGYYRVSLNKAKVYHIGNVDMGEFDTINLENNKIRKLNIQNNYIHSKIPYFIKKYLVRCVLFFKKRVKNNIKY